jgi:NADH-quinone oxidoreductase subunit L
MTLVLLLIVLFPITGFLVLGLGHRAIPKRLASFIGPGTIFLSFLLSVVVFAGIYRNGGTTTGNIIQPDLFSWISSSAITIPFSFLVDPLSCLMILVVTGVGFIIHLYSVGYMGEDPGYNRFFSFMNLFVFFMLLLVLGGNYLVLFIGWEGVGLCSYLLIGFWFRNRQFNSAAKKAFIMNRIGDLGFLLGLFLIFTTFGTLDYTGVFSQARTMQPGSWILLAITLLLFIGATGKSAQIPLYTWLPDAMAGPTPVSALIHAATMVTAGVYMVARSSILYALSPGTMEIIGLTGLATALLAAVIAMFQNDIKKILAYSTISQLGYMFLGLSVGAYTGAMFHLTTHAFFKALLFLGAGSVIHVLGGEQDIRKMGGLAKHMPVTYWAFLAGTLAITAIPPFAGFFSKDEILTKVFGFSYLVWAFALAGSLVTAFYMFRLFYLSFSGKFRGTLDQEKRLHESPKVMTLSLVVLAILSLAGGILNLPALMHGDEALSTFLSPVFTDAVRINNFSEHPPSHAMEWGILALSVGLILVTVWLAYRHYVVKRKLTLPGEAEGSFFPRVTVNKFYIDELYDFLFVRPTLWLSEKLHRFVELKFIDRIVNGIGNLAIRTGNTLRYIQTGHVGFYLFMMVIGIIVILLFNLVL